MRRVRFEYNCSKPELIKKNLAGGPLQQLCVMSKNGTTPRIISRAVFLTFLILPRFKCFIFNPKEYQMKYFRCRPSQLCVNGACRSFVMIVIIIMFFIYLRPLMIGEFLVLQQSPFKLCRRFFQKTYDWWYDAVFFFFFFSFFSKNNADAN